MKLDYIKQNRKIISGALSGISVTFAVLIFMQIMSYFKLCTRAQNIENTVKAIIAADSKKPDDINNCLSPAKEIANNLKKNNLFVKPAEKKNPITEIRCILGDEVCINDKWYKEGEMYQDAKIVKLEPTQVTIEWDGKTIVFRPLEAPGASPVPGERPPSGSPSGALPRTPPRILSSVPSEPPSEPESTPAPVPNIVPNPPFSPGQLSGLPEQIKIEDAQRLKTMIQNMSIVEREKMSK